MGGQALKTIKEFSIACALKRVRPRLTVWPFMIGLLMIYTATTPVAAQDVQALLDRIERLERDIRTLNVQLARGDSSAATLVSGESAASGAGADLTGPAIARFDARMTSLEEDVRLATGTMEEMDHRIRTIESQLEKLVSDIDFRLSELEQGRTPSMSEGMSTGQTTEMGQQVTGVPAIAPVTQDVGQTADGVLGTITETELQQISSEPRADESATVTGTVTSTATQSTAGVQSVTTETAVETLQPEAAQQAALTPKEQYTNAFGLLRQAKYDDAAVALQEFIDQHPDDKLTPNARYWLGETYYVRSEFVRAAEVFFEGYRLAPSASKAPDTLLKLGMALGNLNKKVEACAAFTKLADEFPNASASVRTALERERLRNGC